MGFDFTIVMLFLGKSVNKMGDVFFIGILKIILRTWCGAGLFLE
jgi:hypothetical protein